jgi:hypothetical protein
MEWTERASLSRLSHHERAHLTGNRRAEDTHRKLDMSKIGISILVGIVLLSSGKKTITLADPGGVDTVTFPAASFSEDEVKAIMRLSPLLRMSTSYPVLNQIETCIKGDAEYQGCGTEAAAQGRLFDENANVNINRMEIALETLNELGKVKGLDKVIQYQRKLQMFYIDANKVRLQFHRRGDTSALEEPIEGINPRTQCMDSLARVKTAKSQETKDRIVLMDWYNCMNRQLRTMTDPYPTDAWLAFLKKANISEKYIPVED